MLALSCGILKTWFTLEVVDHGIVLNALLLTMAKIWILFVFIIQGSTSEVVPHDIDIN